MLEIVDYLFIFQESLVIFEVTKVDRRVLRTQEALKKAVIELMAEKKFDAITIQDIADRANVNRGTIYLHYLDKYDLLEKLVEAHIAELEEISAWACKLDWFEGVVPFFEYFEKHYLFFSTMLASDETPAFFRTRLLALFIEGFKEELTENGDRSSGLNPDIRLQYAGTAYVGIIEWWIKNGMPYPPQVVARQVGVLLERSL